MKKRKIHSFITFLHCLALALPLLMLVYMYVVSFFNGYTAVDLTQGVSQSVNYNNDLDINDIFTYFNTNYLTAFSVVNVDFMSAMGITSTLGYIVFINWYCNYLINISLVLFLPEVLLIFISIARNLVLRWDDSIKGGY